MTRAMAGRTALYRLYDADGQLLYVGISANPDLRRDAIRNERPRWNIQHAVWDHPDSKVAKMYGEYAEALDEMRVLLPQIRQQAAADLKAGVPVRTLTEMTGLTAEYFRRIARAEGVERKRPPTVGPLAKPNEGQP